MKLLFPIICIFALATSLSAEEAEPSTEPLSLASQAMIQQVLKSLGDNLGRYNADPKMLSEAVANTLERADQIVEASQTKNQAETEALIAKIETTCLEAENPADLDTLFKKVTEQSLTSANPYGNGDRGQLSGAVTIIGSWQDLLNNRASGDAQAALRSIEQILRSLSQSPCISRSKVLAIKKEIETNATEQKREQAALKEKSRLDQYARQNLEQQREQDEMQRRQNPVLPDPEWPETLGSVSEIAPLLERLQALVLKFQKEFPGRGSASYGTFETRLFAVQRAAAESESSRPAGVIEVLGKSGESHARQQYINGRPNMFPPPASLINTISDFEAELLRSSFQSLFGDAAEVVPEDTESPRSYIGKIAKTLAGNGRYDELLELLPLISMSSIYGVGGDSSWIKADTEGIAAFLQANAFLEADDLRNAVPAFRKVIESGGRYAPIDESAETLARTEREIPGRDEAHPLSITRQPAGMPRRPARYHPPSHRDG